MNRSQIAKTNTDTSLSTTNKADKGGISMPAVPVLQQKSRQVTPEANTLIPDANIVQLFPEAIDDDNAKALSSLHNEAYSEKGDDDFTADELAEIKAGVFMLTALSPKGMKANCIGWAQNSDSIEPTGSMYTWEQKYTATNANAGDAKIILWGEEEAGGKVDIQHASVRLTHAEIAARSKVFGGFKEITTKQLSDAGIDDPCWTSAGGFGYGVIVHPRNWPEGGAFGTALKGMK